MAGLCEGGNEPLGSLKAIKEEMILRDMLLELNDSCEQYGMKINTNKTKSMVIGRKTKKVNLRILHEAVEQVDSFKYLRLNEMKVIMPVKMSPGSSTESYPAFAHLGLRENPGKNLNQVTCPDRESNPGHLVSRPDALTITPQWRLVNLWIGGAAIDFGTYKFHFLISLLISRLRDIGPNRAVPWEIRITAYYRYSRKAYSGWGYCRMNANKYAKTVAKFMTLAHTLPLPPEPIVTGWGTWLNEVCGKRKERR
ncbi:hypothetical protein ANN_27391 [Periplaneta americana]|uniref:Uncharacterized protein n=1 Tax=Periplaneta americana TaxID=6978 RepID=A0ABQ8RVQ8_PERAM|nr:hypothetical protein ANN_27391 [Periplaneta americana]